MRHAEGPSRFAHLLLPVVAVVVAARARAQPMPSRPMPAPTACHALTSAVRSSARVSQEGDHFVVDLEVAAPPTPGDVVLGPGVRGAYGVERVVRASVQGGIVRVRFVPRAEFSSAQIEIPTRCAAGAQVTIANVVVGFLRPSRTYPSDVQVQMMERAP